MTKTNVEKTGPYTSQDRISPGRLLRKTHRFLIRQYDRLRMLPPVLDRGYLEYPLLQKNQLRCIKMLLNAFALLRSKQLFKRLCHGPVVHSVTVNEELLVNDKMIP